MNSEHVRSRDSPALWLVSVASVRGVTMAAMTNAANEVAVQAFVEGRLGFSGIWDTVAQVLSNATPRDYQGKLEMILEDDAWAREEATRLIMS